MLSSVARASRPCSPGPTGQRPVPLPNQAEASFEVSDPKGMNAYGVRWSEGMTEVEPYGLSKLNLDGEKNDSPFMHVTANELDDVRWLFCLAVPNISKAVPLDVRKFLATLVA